MEASIFVFPFKCSFYFVCVLVIQVRELFSFLLLAMKLINIDHRHILLKLE